MKITESQLKEIVLEEIEFMVEAGEIDEGVLDRLRARAAGLGTKIKGGAQDLAARGLSSVARGAGKLGVQGATKAAGEIEKQRAGAAKSNKLKVAQKKISSIVDRNIEDMINDLAKLGFNQTVLGQFQERTAEFFKVQLLRKFEQFLEAEK